MIAITSERCPECGAILLEEHDELFCKKCGYVEDYEIDPFDTLDAE